MADVAVEGVQVVRAGPVLKFEIDVCIPEATPSFDNLGPR